MSSYTPHTPISYKVPSGPAPIAVDTPDGTVYVEPPPFIPSQEQPDFADLEKSASAVFFATGGADSKHRNASVAVGVGALILAKLGLNLDIATSLALGVGAGGGAWWWLSKPGSHAETTYW